MHTHSFTEESYASIIPNVDALCTTYHIDPDVAFLLSRPKFKSQITQNALAVEGTEVCVYMYYCCMQSHLIPIII